MNVRLPVLLPVVLLFTSSFTWTASISAQTRLPRTTDGKPNLQGIWQARSRSAYDLQDHAASYGMPAGKGVVEGGEIPYQPAALAKKQQNYASRQTADPLGKCYMP